MAATSPRRNKFAAMALTGSKKVAPASAGGTTDESKAAPPIRADKSGKGDEHVSYLAQVQAMGTVEGDEFLPTSCYLNPESNTIARCGATSHARPPHVPSQRRSLPCSRPPTRRAPSPEPRPRCRRAVRNARRRPRLGAVSQMGRLHDPPACLHGVRDAVRDCVHSQRRLRRDVLGEPRRGHRLHHRHGDAVLPHLPRRSQQPLGVQVGAPATCWDGLGLGGHGAGCGPPQMEGGCPSCRQV